MSTLSEPTTESPPSSYSAAASATYDPVPRWDLPALVAFRVCFIYFGLYVITTQMLTGMLPIPGVELPDLGSVPPMRDVFRWVGAHIMGIGHPISANTTGSGDRLFDWVQAFALLLITVIGCAVWTARDRGGVRDVRINKWFRLFLRFALGTTMISYGFAKAIPLQMPTTMLGRLIEPYGNFSPMGVLWSSIGASPAYEVFVGSAEVLGGVLLFLPRTATLGALLCLADTIEVWMLNMTYDVPVKLFSFHLILMSLFLLAPNIRRLFDLIFLQREVRLVAEPVVGQGPRSRRNIVVAQGVFGLYAVLATLFGAAQAYKQYGGGSPTSAFFGIWEVDEMSTDGVVRPPLLTDSTRWKRAVFQFPTATTFQQMRDTVVRFTAAIDTNKKTLTLTSADSLKAKYDLKYERPAFDRLAIDGRMMDHDVHMQLRRRDPNSYLLEKRGFHWVSEVPFNR